MRRALALAALFASACAHAPVAPRPAPISHVVLIKLNHPEDRAELIADCDRLLASIRGVSAYAAGTPLDTGRATVDGGYDVGLYVGFADEAGYVADPGHVDLVTKWKPRSQWLRVHDYLDPTP